MRRADELRSCIGYWVEAGLYLGPRRWQNNALHRYDGDLRKLKVHIDSVVPKVPTLYQGAEMVAPSYLVVFTTDTGFEYAASPARFERIIRLYPHLRRNHDERR